MHPQIFKKCSGERMRQLHKHNRNKIQGEAYQ